MATAASGEQALHGEAMFRMPSCLLKLSRVLLSNKLRALFILILMLLSLGYLTLYWRTVEDSNDSALYSSPLESSCAPSVPFSQPQPSGTPPSRGNVFFVETSEQTKPGYLFSCSVESAARAHPETSVVVLMRGLEKGNTSLPKHWVFSLLCSFPNVQIRPLDLPELFSGTPLENWYLSPQRKSEPYFLHVLSDACRIVLMWKYGGIYLDTDFIVLRNLENLTNSMGIQTYDELNGAFLSFSPKHEFVELCLKDFVENYNAGAWGHQGPGLVTRIFKRWCPTKIIQSMSCKGVRALAPKVVYPIPWQNWKKLFEAASALELQKLLNNSFAVHVWNKLSHSTRLEIPSQALLAQLYSQFCPATFAKMRQDYQEGSTPSV